jgi:hypothetical protein
LQDPWKPQSGAGLGFEGPARVSDNVLPGLDDAFFPIDEGTEPGPDLLDVRDTSEEQAPAKAPLALWEQLTDLDADQRANAEIEVELSGAASGADHDAAVKIAALWNNGEYELALAQLRLLEESGAPLGLGIAWKVPLPPGTVLLTDVRIGGTRADAQTMNLDFDAQNGNLFTVVRWGTTTGTSVWTMNISTDDGLTWSETYAFTSSVGLIDADCAVVDDYVYVAYVVGNATNEARIRRCLVSTGAIDGGYSFHTIFDAGANAVEEVALASNADDYDNRIYYAIIQNNDVLRWAWDEATDGTTFSEDSPGSSNPEFGLDMTWDNNLDTCSDFLYVSYAGNDGHIHVLGHIDFVWTDWIVESGAGSFRTTAISAYQNTIICAFEYPFTDGTGIRYRISYNCGDSWSPGTLAVPDGSAVFGYFEPDVDARDGDGTAIIYQAEAGAYDPMYYRTRAGFAPGAWSDPTLFSDHDVYTGSDTALGHVPPLAAELFSHGAMYLSLDPDNRTLYFDRPGASGAPCDDTTPPLVDIELPASLECACDLVEITGSVNDPDGTYAGDRLEYRRRNVAAWTVADTAIGARAGLLYTWDTSALPQDFYYVRIVGENECALSASDSTFVYKSTSFGNADLRAPVDGGVYARNVCFDGTAWTQSCFEQYTADYRPAGGGAWNPVDPPNSPYLTTVINDPLATWNTASGPTSVPDGDYEVRLQGMTVCGDTATVVHTITVDNTSPTATITSPTPCDYVTGLVNVIGTADDANLNGWTLQYTGGGTSSWTTISSGNAPVINGLLGRWDTAALPSCAYTLRLVVTDIANVNCSGDPQQTIYQVSVNVGCAEDIDGDGDVDLADLATLLGVYGTTCP